MIVVIPISILTGEHVIVAEAGASPLEPYNGGIAIEMLTGKTAFTLLCASDPYAVVGVREAFGLQPDLVGGPAASTSAGISLIRKLTGVPSVNVMDAGANAKMRSELERILKVPLPAG